VGDSFLVARNVNDIRTGAICTAKHSTVWKGRSDPAMDAMGTNAVVDAGGGK
jgi:hypothetical protein